MTSHEDQCKRNQRSICAANMVQFRLLFPELHHFEKSGVHHFSLIGRHLESVGQTVLVFELHPALSDKKLTYEFQSDSGIFLSSYRHKLQPLCQGKGHRAKNRTKMVKLVEAF